jgi:hypothetical protein
LSRIRRRAGLNNDVRADSDYQSSPKSNYISFNMAKAEPVSYEYASVDVVIKTYTYSCPDVYMISKVM